MAIRNGDLCDADEVLNNLGVIPFKNFSNVLYNSALSGFNSDFIGDWKNLIYDETPSINSGAYPFSVIDEHNDSVVDPTIWSTSGSGSVSENTERMSISATTSEDTEPVDSIAIANQASAPNIGDQSLVIRYGYSLVTSGTNTLSRREVKIKIHDGTASAILVSHSIHNNSNGVETGIAKNIRINIDKTNKTAHVTEDLTDSTKTGISLAALNNAVAWRIEYVAHAMRNNFAGIVSASLDIYQTRSLFPGDNSVFNYDLHSSETYLDAIGAFNSSIGDGTSIKYELSADGTNYEEVNDAEIHRFTNTGTDLKLKVTLTASDDTYPEIARLNHYAVWYNTGAG